MVDVSTILTIICTTLGSWLLYKRFRGGFWKRCGAPCCPPGLNLGYNLTVFTGRQQIGQALNRIYEFASDQPFVGYYEMTKPVLLMRDPRLIGNMLIQDSAIACNRLPSTLHVPRLGHNLLFSKDDKWKSLRTYIVSMFTPNKLRLMFDQADRCARTLVEMLPRGEWLDDEKAVNMEEITSRYVIDVMGSVTFGFKFDTLQKTDSPLRTITYKIHEFGWRGLLVFISRIIAPRLSMALRITLTRPGVEPFLDHMMRHGIQLHRFGDLTAQNFLHMLLDMRDRDRKSASQCAPHETAPAVVEDDDVILSNVFSLYSVGFQTTFSALNYCLYELATHESVQKRLRQEIQEKLASNSGQLSPETVASMTYMEMVLFETLRMHNPISGFNRMVSQEYDIPGTSVVLPVGTQIRVPVYSLHHDPKYYPEPYKFDPERFTRENVEARPPFVFLPFGDGPRTCVGQRLAKNTIKVCLCRLLLEYEFVLSSKTETPIKMKARTLIFEPKNSIWLRMSKIDNNHFQCKE